MSDSRKNIQHYKIFDYWKDKAITNNGDIVDVNDEKYFSSSIEVVYDWGEPECFACRKLVAPVLDDKDYEQWLEDEEGLKKIWNHRETRRNLERAHIIPHSLGGNENPDNMFLLCKECHEESPDTNNPKNFVEKTYSIFWRWGYSEYFRLLRKCAFSVLFKLAAAVGCRGCQGVLPSPLFDSLSFGCPA